MEIKILKNAENLKGRYLKDKLILEKIKSKSQYENIDTINYKLTNIETNQTEEILPSIEKYDLGEIHNISPDSEFVYFYHAYQNNEQDYIEILRYNFVSNTVENIYTFKDFLQNYKKQKRLKIFIINDLYIIIQHEYKIIDREKKYEGYFKFKLQLINMKDQSEYDILDENFVKNGISEMVAVSDNLCVVRTGYSLLPDSLYNMIEQQDVSLESICFINIGQLISDLLISQNCITVETIDQAYYNKTIPYLRKLDDYIVYSCVDMDEKEEEIKFYNINTKETKSCINKHVVRMSDLAKTYVINNEPYICITKEKSYEFLNLNSGKIDTKFNTDQQLKDVFKQSVLFTGHTKQFLFKKAKPFIDIYSFPQKKQLLHDYDEYLNSFVAENDTLYILTK